MPSPTRTTVATIFEADPQHCHRSPVAAALARRLPLEVLHLRPADQ